MNRPVAPEDLLLSSQSPIQPGATAIVATMHGKEQVIVPALGELGLEWLPLPAGFDTDRFGTFTREVPRHGSAEDAARAKARAALEAVREARFAVASEGSFGPDPQLGFIARGRELVLMVDRESNLELEGHDLSWDTNFANIKARSLTDASKFAATIGFPGHGLILMSPTGRVVSKCLDTWAELMRAVADQLLLNESAFLETDMRAHRNPTRLASIGRAARSLSESALSACPRCGTPGWRSSPQAGRPCAWCRQATLEMWTEHFRCRKCGEERTLEVEPSRLASPGLCYHCNP